MTPENLLGHVHTNADWFFETTYFFIRIRVRLHLWGFSIGFSGPGISLIWSSGCGVWKQNRDEFRDWSMLGRWDVKYNPRDNGISRNFGSGLRDWRPTLVSSRWKTDSCRIYIYHLHGKTGNIRLENQMVGAIPFVVSFAALFRLVTQRSSPK